MGDIPEHWELRKVKYLGKIVNGYAFKSNDFKGHNTGCRVMKIANIQHMKLDWSDESFVDESFYENLSSYRILNGELVFALTRPIISSGIKASIVNTEEKILLNQRNAVFKPAKKFNIALIYYQILNQIFVEHFESLIDDVGQQPNISSESIANIVIPVPPKCEQEKIVQYLSEKIAKIDTIITKYEKQISLLEEYRTSLISKAVTGQIDVLNWKPQETDTNINE